MSKFIREAIVVGLCAHGLDMVRALSLNGVRVHALESDPVRPGVQTDLATVHLVDDVNGRGLVPAIIEVVGSSQATEPPVLLLTNDKMVFEVAANADLLADKVMLSWAASRALVPTLMHKDSLPSICSRANLKYPKSAVVKSLSLDAIEEAIDALSFPLMVKPVRPMASFKAVLLSNFEEVRLHVEHFQQDLPMVVQEWVPGGVTSLKFCAIYFDRGNPLAHFEGRKLDTLPRGLGVTTAAEPIDAPELYRAALRFFSGFAITGPVSLEVKEDPTGAFWVIEPTVFRTDYWAGCCIANGVNLPLIEYRHQAGLVTLPRTHSSPRVWIDLERDPASIISTLRVHPTLLFRPWRIAPTYLSTKDPRPFVCLIAQWIARLRSSLRRRIGNSMSALLG